MRTRTAIVLLLLIAAVGSGAGYYFYRNRPAGLLLQAQAAMERGDRNEAERLAALLDQRGQNDAAHLIRGKAIVVEGRDSIDRAGGLARYDALEAALFLLLDAAASESHPIAFLPAALMTHSRAGARTSRVAGQAGERLWRRQRAEFEVRANSAWVQALNELGQISPESPLRVEGDALAGECFVRLGDPRRALQILNQVVKQQPDNVEAHRWLAVVHFDLGSMHPAIDHLREVGRLDTADGRPFRQIGLIYKDYDQKGPAIEAYREALKRQLKPPVVAEVVRELAELLARDGKYSEALDVLKQCPEPFADRPEFLAVRADCLFSYLDQKAEAIELVERALRMNPDYVYALYLRGRMYLTVEKPKEALHFLERAARLDPLDEGTLSHIVQAYRQLGDVPHEKEFLARAQEARKFKSDMTDLNAAAMSKPYDEALRIQIAKLWLSVNKFPEARMWLEAARSLNPQNEAANRLMKELEGKQ